MDVYRLFKRGEQVAICKAALASEGPLSTPELALRVMRAKGMNEAGRVLRKAVALRLVHAMPAQAACGIGFICADRLYAMFSQTQLQ